jgi:hypothetical protein
VGPKRWLAGAGEGGSRDLCAGHHHRTALPACFRRRLGRGRWVSAAQGDGEREYMGLHATYAVSNARQQQLRARQLQLGSPSAASAASSPPVECAGRFHLGIGPFWLRFTYVTPVLVTKY